MPLKTIQVSETCIAIFPSNRLIMQMSLLLYSSRHGEIVVAMTLIERRTLMISKCSKVLNYLHIMNVSSISNMYVCVPDCQCIGAFMVKIKTAYYHKVRSATVKKWLFRISYEKNALTKPMTNDHLAKTHLFMKFFGKSSKNKRQHHDPLDGITIIALLDLRMKINNEGKSQSFFLKSSNFRHSTNREYVKCFSVIV